MKLHIYMKSGNVVTTEHVDRYTVQERGMPCEFGGTIQRLDIEYYRQAKRKINLDSINYTEIVMIEEEEA